MIPTHLPTLLTCEETAKILRVTPATVRNMIHDGRITAVPMGRPGKRPQYRVPLTSLESLLGFDQTQALREMRSPNA